MFSMIKRIHFIGIGGIGMSGIAEVLVNSGYEVSGSDIKVTPTVSRLEKMGIKIFLGHDAQNVENAQVVVVSSAINKHNPELVAAASTRIPVIHRSEMLAELMRLKYGVCVAGTHGKTTTTSILATALTGAGLDPTLVIGGKLNALDSNAKLGKGDLFVAEADESDGSFLRLTPAIAVITNIDKDHLDHYSGFDEILQAFESFVDKIPFYGAVCACIDDPAVQLLLPKVRRKLVTFGLRQDADVTVQNLAFEGFHTSFVPLVYGVPYDQVKLKMPGRYNVANALASFAVGAFLGLDLNLVSKAISDFAGVLHRFTVIGNVRKTTVIDDYAHNPKKISTVLRGIRESFPDARVCAVFQPHRYSRLKFMGDEFALSFADADCVVVTPIYAASEQPIAGITSESVAQQIRAASFQNAAETVLTATSLENAAQLAAQLIQKQGHQHDTIVITLGAGDVQSVGPVVIKLLS